MKDTGKLSSEPLGSFYETHLGIVIFFVKCGVSIKINYIYKIQFFNADFNSQETV